MKEHGIKKRWFIFLLFLVLAFLVVYLQPIFFPRQVQTIRPQDSQAIVEGGNTTLQAEPIAAAGFAKLIGKPEKELEKQYGKPTESYDSGYGFTIKHYQSDEPGYLEASIKDGKIAAVKTTGIDGEPIAPFQLNMSMGDLAEITMLYPNFTIVNDDEAVEIELMEEDLNYRPLVTFDNGTYSILFFNAESKLIGVMYLTTEMLLKLAPYNLVQGTPPKMEATVSEDQWEPIDQAKEKQGYQLFNLLREQDQLERYDTTFTLQGQSRDFLSRFLKKPANYLEENRYENFRKVTEDASNAVFMLSGQEFSEVARAVEVPYIDGFFETPCYDPTFQILSWYSDPFMHNRFMKKDPQAMAIGISAQNMVILFEDVKATKDSD